MTWLGVQAIACWTTAALAAEESPPGSAAARPEPPVVVYGVELESGRGRDRILVFGQSAFGYRMVGTDPRTVEIRIPHAVLDPSAAASLAAEAGGTVTRVEAFERLVDGDPEVHVVIGRREGFHPEVTQRGPMLAVDFERPAASESLVLQVRDADLRDVAGIVARAAGLDLIFDESLSGTVTITSDDEITAAEAVQLLNAVLLLEGFVAVPTPSGALKVVAIAGAAAAAPWRSVGDSGEGTALATLVRLRRANPGEVVQALAPFVDASTLVRSVEGSDAMIVAGAAPRVRRALTLARLLDDAEHEELLVRRMRHAEAQAASALLRSALGGNGRAGTGVAVWPIPRSNDVVVWGAPELLARARALLARIDVPRAGGGALRVLPVLHADPEALAEMLRRTPAGEAVEAFAGDVPSGRAFNITVDEHTGSLLVLGDPETLRSVADVVAELDRPQRQIDLEVILFEVSTAGSLALGFEAFLPFGTPGSSDVFGSVTLDPSGGGLPAEAGERNFLARFEREPILIPITGPGGETISVLVPQETAVIIADEGAVATRVLMRPHLTMASGEENEIFAGDNVPIPVASAGGNALDLTTRRDIQREDVGVRVRVRPTLGERGDVWLDLEVDERRVIPSSEGDVTEVGVTYQQRQLDTRIRIADGEIAVVGTLEQQTLLDGERGTPFLKDVPALGNFFRLSGTRTLERRLVIAVHARVLPGPEELLARSIRRRLAIERRLAGTDGLVRPVDAPYALLVATRRTRAAADATAASLRAAGNDAQVTSWAWLGEPRHEVYVTGYRDLPGAGAAALRLRGEGFDPMLTVLP